MPDMSLNPRRYCMAPSLDPNLGVMSRKYKVPGLWGPVSSTLDVS